MAMGYNKSLRYGNNLKERRGKMEKYVRDSYTEQVHGGTPTGT